MLAIAAKLAEAREIFRYRRDKGGFTGWVESRLNFSESTAYKLLDVHARFDGAKSFHIVETLPRSVLYLLAAPSTPEPARAEVLERAEAGERLKHAEVREIINAHGRDAVPGRRHPNPRRGLAGARRCVDATKRRQKRSMPEPPQDADDGAGVKLRLGIWRIGQDKVSRGIFDRIGEHSKVAVMQAGREAQRDRPRKFRLARKRSAPKHAKLASCRPASGTMRGRP